MGTIQNAVGTITGKLAQLLALYAEEEALRKRLQDDPPDDPLEYAQLLNDAAALADKIAALATEISSGTSKLSTAEIAALNAETHANNQTTWSSTLPDPPDTSGIAYWRDTQSTEPDRSKLKPGDGVYRNARGNLWTVWDPESGVQAPQPPAWKRVN